MGYRVEPYKGDLAALRRFLENTLETQAREAAHAEGCGTLVSISPIGAFHASQGLSPAAGFAVGSQKRIWVSDEFNHRVLVYGPDLSPLMTIGRNGTGPGEFRYPRGMAAGAGGEVYVADAWNHRIVVLAPNGEMKKTFGSLGTGAGELDEPVGVAFFGNLLAVLEKSNHRIQIFDTEGNPRGVIGHRGPVTEQEQFYAAGLEPENFIPPGFEFPSAVASCPDGGLYVADTNNHRVVKIRADGSFDSTFSASGVRYPVGLACDGTGNLHVTQFNVAHIAVYSPSSALLYRYAPAGLDSPGAIAVAGETLLIGDSMKAAGMSFSISAGHGAGLALEGPCAWHLKTAYAAFAAGDAGAGMSLLELAAQSGAVDGAVLADLLPEDDCRIPSPPGDSPDVGRFSALLEGAAKELWSALEGAFARKAAAAGEMAGAMLQIEKGVLAGLDTEEQTIARYRANRRIIQSTGEFKHALYLLAKTDEMAVRLARAGADVPRAARLLAARMDNISALKGTMAEWVAAAAKDAPALSFNSPPDEREAFTLNEARIDAAMFEFSSLWEMAARCNLRMAALLRGREKDIAAESLDAYLEKASAFSAVEPLSFQTRTSYFLSLEALAEAVGGERMKAYLAARADASRWAKLGREDNIPAETSGGVYHLLPALWAARGAAGNVSVEAEPWEKVNGFYIGEFRKYVDESASLLTELLRQMQALPHAEKTDPRQAALTARRISLLRFHVFFQQRYIGNMIAEYAIRFALFTLERPPLSPAQAAQTVSGLDRLMADAVRARVAGERTMFEMLQKASHTENIAEKQDLRARAGLAAAASEFYLLLCAHCALIRRLAGASAGELVPPRRFSIHENGSGTRGLSFPSAARFDADGGLHVLSWYAVSKFGASGDPLSFFGGFRAWAWKSAQPFDMAITPPGDILLSQLNSPKLSWFRPDGTLVRECSLEKTGGRLVYHIGVDEKGSVYASFVDGNGFNIYSPDGVLQKEVPLQGSPFEAAGSFKAFALVNGLVYAGGNGKIIAAAIGETGPRFALDSGIPFAELCGFAFDGKDTFFLSDYFNNIVLRTDERLASASPVTGINIISPSAVAAKDGLLAVCDNKCARVIVYEL